MNTIALTADNFVQTIEKPGIVLIDWWASWCGPCRAFAPVYEGAAEKHPDVVFGKIDTDAEGALAAAFHIQAIPTLMAFRDGYGIFSRPGLLSGAGLDALISEIRALDMEEVRLKHAESARKAGAPAQ